MSAAAAPRAPLAVYMLADHLDASLAAGEDLMARGHDWRALSETATSDAAAFAETQRVVAEDVRSFELMLIARMLKAREHARALGTMDKRFATVARLFAAGTLQLLDAVGECDDARNADFESGDGLVAYVRSRGLITQSAAGLATPAELTIDDGFLVARRMPLGPLLDMAATFLDALETHYDIFEDADGDARERRTSLPEVAEERDHRDRIVLN